MKKYIAIILVVLGFFIVSISAAEDSQPARENQWKDCLILEHGWMMRCLEQGIEALSTEVKKNAAKPTVWQAPEEAAKEANPEAANDESIEAGRVVFERNCLTCHGASGRGDGPSAVYYGARVADLTDPSLAKRTDGEVFWKITEGTWPMPSFGAQENLSRKDVWNAINFIRTLSDKPKAETKG